MAARAVLGIFLTLALPAASPALADDSRESCVYGPEGKQEKLELIHLEGLSLIRMRFLGTVPDRYFAATGGKGESVEYVQFATRAGQTARHKLATVRASRLVVTHLLGGNRYEWVQGPKKHALDCKRAP